VSAFIRCVAAAAALCCLAASTVVAGPAAVPRAPHPELVLPESGASGQRAIDLLGDYLPAVAAAYGKTPEELRRLLLSDPTMRLDKRGHLYYVEEPAVPVPHAGSRPASAAF